MLVLDANHFRVETLAVYHTPCKRNKENSVVLFYVLSRTESLYLQQAVLVPLKQETHGGEDVALYAQGPMAHLVRGVLEHNVVAHILDYAAGLGDSQGRRSRCLDSPSSSTALFSTCIAPWVVTIVALLVTALR